MTDSRVAPDPNRLPGWPTIANRAAKASGRRWSWRRYWWPWSSPACPSGWALETPAKPRMQRRPSFEPCPLRRRSPHRSRRSSNLAPLRSSPRPCRLSSQRPSAPSGLPRLSLCARPSLRSRPPISDKSKASAAEDEPAAAEKTAAVPAAPAKPVVARPIARPGPLRLWPAIVSDGANGRVVRIGAYGSRLNAKKGWQQIVSRYPGMRRLKAVVAPVPAPRIGQDLLPAAVRNHFAGPFGGAVPTHARDPQDLRRGRTAAAPEGRSGKGSPMSDSRSNYDDGQLPWLEAVDDEDGPRGVSGRKMLAALLVVLAAAVIVAGTFFYLGRRESGRHRSARADPRPAWALQNQAERPRRARRRGRERDGVPDQRRRRQRRRARPRTRFPKSRWRGRQRKSPSASRRAKPRCRSRTSRRRPRPPSGGSGSVIQLGAFKNAAQAERAWTALSSRFPSVAGDDQAGRALLGRFPACAPERRRRRRPSRPARRCGWRAKTASWPIKTKMQAAIYGLSRA